MILGLLKCVFFDLLLSGNQRDRAAVSVQEVCPILAGCWSRGMSVEVAAPS